MAHSPLISVLIPTLNEEENIEQAVKSVRKQSVDNVEILVCDAGSTDETKDIARSLLCEENIMTDREGLMSQMNSLVSAASGEYCSVLDADAKMLSGRLKNQVEVLDNQPRVGAVGTALQRRTPGGKLVKKIPAATGKEIRWQAIKTMPVWHTTAMFRKRAVQNIGGYRDRPFGDYDLMVRLAKNWDLYNIDEILTESLERESKGDRTYIGLTRFIYNTKTGLIALCSMNWSPTELPLAISKRTAFSGWLAVNILLKNRFRK